MLDVHILSIADRKGRQFSRCLDSVERAAKAAPFPVGVHVIDNQSEGHIGLGRQAGYAMGTGKYVTNVDDDDWVEERAFSILAPAMEMNAPAIYTSFHKHAPWGYSVQRGKKVLLRVFRRDILEGFDFSLWPSMDGPAIVAHADRQGPSVMIDDPVYHYVLAQKSASSVIAAKNPQLAKQYKEMLEKGHG